MKLNYQVILFVTFDYLTALLAWFLFYAYRVTEIEHTPLVFKGSFYAGMIIIPLCWLFLYAVQGTYYNLQRIYRLKMIKQTFFGTLLGSVLVFFALVLNDFVDSYTQFYSIILV